METAHNCTGEAWTHYVRGNYSSQRLCVSSPESVFPQGVLRSTWLEDFTGWTLRGKIIVCNGLILGADRNVRPLPRAKSRTQSLPFWSERSSFTFMCLSRAPRPTSVSNISNKKERKSYYFPFCIIRVLEVCEYGCVVVGSRHRWELSTLSVLL